MTSQGKATPEGISVVVPSYNPRPEHLGALYQSLLEQSYREFEVIIVDDASQDADYSFLTDPRFRIIHREKNCGPAACRNAGADAASSEFVFFTDTDCELAPDTLRQAVEHLSREDAIMGNTITRVKTRFGKAVALLGFPGGGILGFDRVWRVDASGYTDSFSSCNLAFRRSVFNALGRFNETFPVAGGEDTVLARKMISEGRRIRYLPEQIVYHLEKSDLRSFIRWQIIRGRGNYHIRQHVPEVRGYLWLRLWTFKNSLQKAGPFYAPLVLALIVLSVFFQIKGYRMEKARTRS